VSGFYGLRIWARFVVWHPFCVISFLNCFWARTVSFSVGLFEFPTARQRGTGGGGEERCIPSLWSSFLWRDPETAEAGGLAGDGTLIRSSRLSSSLVSIFSGVGRRWWFGLRRGCPCLRHGGLGVVGEQEFVAVWWWCGSVVWFAGRGARGAGLLGGVSEFVVGCRGFERLLIPDERERSGWRWPYVAPWCWRACGVSGGAGVGKRVEGWGGQEVGGGAARFPLVIHGRKWSISRYIC
jgi:hypothetical protein